MEKPLKQNFTTPFDGDLVIFDSKSYAKALEAYIEEMENNLIWVWDRINAISKEVGTYGDAGDQALQTLEPMIAHKSAEITLQWLANATKTYVGCHGHGKAKRNEKLAAQYKKRLESMGVNVPPENELLQMGDFNGPGSV